MTFADEKSVDLAAPVDADVEPVKCLDCSALVPDGEGGRCRSCRVRYAERARARCDRMPDDDRAAKVTAARARRGKEGPPVPRGARLEQLSMFRSATDASVATLVVDPPEFEGWHLELATPRPRIVNGACSEVRRPCPWKGCVHHLQIGLMIVPGVQVEGAEPMITINRQTYDDSNVGRRSGITVNSSDADVEAFVNDAAGFELPRASCVLDRVAEFPDGMSEIDVAADLGVDPETVRSETASAFAKLRSLARAGGYHESDGRPDKALIRMLRKLTGRSF